MNVLSVVDLPSEAWEPLSKQYPELTFHTELRPDRLAELTEWPQVVFGNVPVEWAVAAATRGNLQWLQSVSAGVEVYQPLKKTPARLTSARGIHHQSIAQHLLLMILALTRDLPAQLRNQQAQIWHRAPQAINSLQGKTVGVLGYGGIGRELARLVQPLGMSVVGVSLSCKQTQIENEVQVWPMERMDELMAIADHLVLCLPLFQETESLMNEARFARMRRGACFYNISRGALVDEKALLRSLQDGHLAGAALDVFREEPLPPSHPFWRIPNLIITPHIAGHDLTLRLRSFKLFCQNLSRYLRGEQLINEIL